METTRSFTPLPSIAEELEYSLETTTSTQITQLSEFTPEQQQKIKDYMADLTPKAVIEEVHGYLNAQNYPWQAIKDGIQLLIDKGALEIIPYSYLNIPWAWNELCWEKEFVSLQPEGDETMHRYRYYLMTLKVLPELEELKGTHTSPSVTKDFHVYPRIRPVEDTPFITLREFQDDDHDRDNESEGSYQRPEYDDDGYWDYFDDDKSDTPDYSDAENEFGES